MTNHPLFAGFRIGILDGLPRIEPPQNLTPKQGQVNQSYLAACYGIPRQGLAFHQQRLGLTPTDWLNPDIVFSAMLEKSKACRLRSRLASPSNRAAIAEKITLISKVSNP